MKIKILRLYSQYILQYLDEINSYTDDFNLGQKYALIDVLETMQSNCTIEERRQLNLDWAIEDKYRL